MGTAEACADCVEAAKGFRLPGVGVDVVGEVMEAGRAAAGVGWVWVWSRGVVPSWG